jgi:cobalt-zinc-cadmium efflux system outer membrane protein
MAALVDILRLFRTSCALVHALRLLTVVVVPGVAHAEELTLDLTASLERGARSGPGVAIAQAPRNKLQAAASYASPLITIPARIQVYAGPRVFPNGAAAGFELQTSIIQDFPLRGVGRAREAAVSAQLAAVEADVARARLDAAAQAGLAWVAAREAQEILALRRASHADAMAVLRTARARVTAGTATPHEGATAEAELALADASVLHAEGMLTEALFQLRYATGLEPQTQIVVTGDLFASDEHAIDLARIRESARSHPDVLTADAAVAGARAEADLVRAQLGPSFGIGLLYAHEGTNEQVAAGVLVLPLPWSSPGAYEARRAEANADTATRKAEGMRAQSAVRVEIALHEHEHARAEREAVERALAPLREAVRITKAQWEMGAADITPLAFARRRLLDGEELRVRAAADVRRADIRLEHAAGTLHRGSP